MKTCGRADNAGLIFEVSHTCMLRRPQLGELANIRSNSIDVRFARGGGEFPASNRTE